jgi:hypothetical protein
MSKPRRALITLIALPCVAFLGMATAMAFVIDAPHWMLLFRSQAEASGKITRLVPNSHGAVEIAYTVMGSAFSRLAPWHGPPANRSQDNDITVYYYPPDPSIAFTASADDILDEELPGWIAMSMGGGLVGLVLGFRVTASSVPSLWARIPGPKFLTVGASLGVTVSFVSRMIGGSYTAPQALGDLLMLPACGLLLWLAWWRNLSWRAMTRSVWLWAAVGLVIAANFVNEIH